MTDRYAPCQEHIRRARETIRKLAVCQCNRNAILDFSDHCFSEGLSPRRVLKYLYTLKTIALRFPKDFRKAMRIDIERLVRQIERSNYSEWTKHDYRVTLKKFFRWLRKTEEYPPEVKWLRSTMRNNRTKLPEEILTQEEIRAMIVAAPTVRDKAFIGALYESGCRIGEMMSLRIRHLQQHEHGFQITVEGKTGSRRLLIIACAPHITAWLNDHPTRQNPGAPVWIRADYHTKELSYGRISDILRSVAKRAGIRKAVNPHNFRHSRATHLANHLTEAQMNEYFGWVQGSDMASRYVHLSGRDINNALLKLNRIAIPEEDKQAQKFALMTCPRCSLNNPPGNKFCSRCGMVLDEDEARGLQQRSLGLGKAGEVLDVLVNDEEFRSMLDRKIMELVQSKVLPS